MRAVVVLGVSMWVTVALSCAEAWTMRNGRVFEADLAAADGLRASFTRGGQQAVVIPMDQLSSEDATTIRGWREDWRKPLIFPQKIAAWPPRASAAAGELRLAAETEGRYEYESRFFRITSDLKLPLGTVGDIAKVFEATRAALIAIPLGLHAGGEKQPYEVFLFRNLAGYTAAGGAGGSGGQYDGRTGRMLVLLPNLGIEESGGRLRLDHGRSLFVLKHEVTHQLMSRWHRNLPTWVDEGIAEFIASLPYSQGHYTLDNPSAGMRDYVLKWQKPGNDRTIRLIPPAELMAMDRRAWESLVKQQDAYDRYNSAAVLALYFIRQNQGAPLAGYLDALRRGENPMVAENKHLLNGKSREELLPALQDLCKTLGIGLTPL